MNFFANNSNLLMKWLGYSGLFIVAIFGMTSEIAKGEDIALINLPEIIRKAANAAVPNAKWSKVVKDTDEKHTWYEIKGIDAKGRNVCVTVEPNGELEEIETEIKLQVTPKIVLDALKRRFSNFKISAVYEIRNDINTIVRYNFDGKRPRDKEEITISFSAVGKSINIDE